MAYADAGLASGYFLRLTVTVHSQNIAANTTTYAYSLVIYKGSGSGKWMSGSSSWSVRTPAANTIDGGSIGGYDFRNYSSLTLGSSYLTVGGSGSREWQAHFADNPSYGELGDGVATLNFAPPAIPLTPTGLVVARVSDSQQNLSWSRASTYTGVVVHRRTDGGVWQEVGRPAGNVASFSDTTTEANRKYEYRVAGLAAAGQSGWSNEAGVFTSPAAPASVFAERSGLDIRVTANGLPPHATSFDIEDSGVVVANGVSLPWMHAGPNPANPHTYRVRGAVDAVKGAWSPVSNTVQLITRPNPPTGLSPNGSVSASDVPVRFSWVHAAVDSSAQTAYELRHRAPAGAWTTLSGTVASFRDVTLVVGAREWQVRTKGAHADWSDWSAVATVTVITRPGVAVTQPDVSWDSSILTARWSWLQAQGRPQSSWEVELLDSDGALVDSRAGSGASAEFTFPTRIQEGSWTVRARAASGTVWSAWALSVFEVTFYPPALPALEGSWDEVAGGVSLSIGPGAAEGAPETIRLTLERSIDGGVGWEQMLTLDAPDEMTLMDWESLSRGVTTYRLTAFTLEGAVSEAVLPVLAESPAWWLSAGIGYGRTARLPYDPKPTIEGGRERSVEEYEGRELGVPYAGEHLSRVIAVSGRTRDRDAATTGVDRLVSVVQDPSPIHMLRDPDGRRVYGSVSAVSLPRESQAGVWGYSFSLQESSH